MLDKLHEILQNLPNLLSKTEKWESLVINRRKPYTYRVFTQLENGLRICLHKFESCDIHEAFSHPHPWPGAFIILKGSYLMKIGYSLDRTSPMLDVMSTKLNKWCEYEMTTPLSWHSVIPLETTYTVMVNGTPWDPDIAHSNVRTTKGKDLEKMPEKELKEHLNMFKDLVLDWNLNNNHKGM